MFQAVYKVRTCVQFRPIYHIRIAGRALFWLGNLVNRREHVSVLAEIDWH